MMSATTSPSRTEPSGCKDDEHGDCDNEGRDHDDPADPKLGADRPEDRRVDRDRRPEDDESERWADREPTEPWAHRRSRPKQPLRLGVIVDNTGDVVEAAPPSIPMDERWRGILRGETPLAMMPRLGRRLFALVPSPWRCKFCNAPFRGPYAGTFRRVGYAPSRKNPNICARCIESAPEGGAVVPISVLFADVRGYTSLTERTSSVEVTVLLNRFYAAASRALLAHEAVLGQIAGDEVMALFVPGLAGPGYPRKAIEGARSLLHAMGYGTPEGNWLDVGVGICSGEEYVGNVGGGGFKDFTALGDVTNTSARLQAQTKGGEIMLCAVTHDAAVDACVGAELRYLTLKGKAAPVAGYLIRVS
jgi:class 3 adenylate cyclase